jgi:histone deacetylase complex regulatory component SIN3
MILRRASEAPWEEIEKLHLAKELDKLYFCHAKSKRKGMCENTVVSTIHHFHDHRSIRSGRDEKARLQSHFLEEELELARVPSAHVNPASNPRMLARSHPAA